MHDEHVSSLLSFLVLLVILNYNFYLKGVIMYKKRQFYVENIHRFIIVDNHIVWFIYDRKPTPLFIIGKTLSEPKENKKKTLVLIVTYKQTQSPNGTRRKSNLQNQTSYLYFRCFLKKCITKSLDHHYFRIAFSRPLDFFFFCFFFVSQRKNFLLPFSLVNIQFFSTFFSLLLLLTETITKLIDEKKSSLQDHMSVASCFWALLSLENFDFIYLPNFITDIQIGFGETPGDILLHRSLLQFIHPEELALAKIDLENFVQIKTLAGAVTRYVILEGYYF